MRDPFLRQPLWLQTDIDGQVLWAYNERHLDYLEAYVAARLREGYLTANHARIWMAMADRLPTWLKAANNRERILRSIARMRTSLS